MARKENKLKTSSDMQKWIAAGPEGRHFGDVACAFPTRAVYGCKTNKARECRYLTASLLLLICFAERNCFLEKKREREREYTTGIILFWTFCKKCCHWRYLEEQKQKYKGEGGGNRKKCILWIY